MASADSSTALLRIDQVGSLVAPRTLIDAFDDHAMGNLTADQLKSAQDTAIRDVVQEQEDVGLPIITDGEFRRRNFQESFSAAVQGFEMQLQRRSAPIGMSRTIRCTGRNRISTPPAPLS